MPFRFRRTIGLGKGARLNLGKTGASFSLGGKGATVNLGKRGIRTTLGIPGTGISYTSSTSSTKLDNLDHEPLSAPLTKVGVLLQGIQLFTLAIQFIFYILVLIGICGIAFALFFGS
jgi:hypothetical protein